MASGVLTIDGLVVDVESIKDGFSKAIVKHEIPYRDGALLEDLGQKARTAKFKAIFNGEAYTRHVEFLNRLGKRGLVELQHPVYGMLQGCIESAAVHHDDQVRYAEIDIDFVEQFRAASALNLQPPPPADVRDLVESQTETTLRLAIDSYRLGLRADFGALGISAPEGAALAETPILPDQTVLSQLPNLSSKALGYAAAVDAAVRSLEGTLSAVSQPANSLIGTIAWAEDLPGRVVGTCARVVERYARSVDSLRAFPARFLDRLGRELSGLSGKIESLPEAAGVGGASGIATVARHLALVSASVLALEAAGVYAEDESRRAESKQAEEADTFDMLGYFRGGGASDPVMTLPELEESLALVRTSLSSAINRNRDIGSLKQTAAALLDHVNRVKLERERIAEVTVDNRTPVHLLCLRNSLPRNAADRILSINRIPAPNFAAGPVNVYVR